jgi:hypothetical protein
MRSRTRVLLGVLTAAVVMACAVGSAGARRLSLTEQHFRATWTGANSMIFEEPIAGKVECEVTLEGSFHSRTLSKVSGQLIGYVTRALIRHNCIENEGWYLNGIEVQERVTLPNTLPWHIQYNSFRGVLPRIERIRIAIIGESILLRFPLVTNCLYQSTQAKPLFMDLLLNEMGAIANIEAVPTGQIPFKQGNVNCPAEVASSGRGNIFIQGGVSVAITVRLVQ